MRKFCRMFKPRPAPAEKETVLQQRIRERLQLLRLNPRQASLQADLGPDAIRTILSGRSKSPRGETLSALARVLECEVDYLLGRTDKPWSDETARRDLRGVALGVNRMWITGGLGLREYEQDDFIDTWDDKHEKPVRVSNVYSLPDYLPGRQSLEVCLDDHAAPFCPSGSYVHALSLIGYDTDLKDRDVVILERLRLHPEDDKRSLRQRTIRLVRIYNEHTMVLQLPGKLPDEADEIVWHDERRPREGGFMISKQLGAAFTIFGLVLRIITPVTGPPVEAEREPVGPDLYAAPDDYKG